MNININDLITLDDNKDYVVVSKAFYNNRNYYYLIDINDSSNLMLWYEEDGKLVESFDKSVNNELMPLFIDNACNSTEE